MEATRAMALEQLISASAQGDQRAYKAIYDMLSRRVFRYIQARTATREDAIDILQETFIDLWKALPAFHYEDDIRAEAFLYKIASRKLARYYRFRRVHVALEDAEEIIDPKGGSEHEVLDVLRSLDGMSKPEQEIISLRYMAGMPFKEIAELLGESENALKVRHHRAIQRLKNLLQEE